ncbi:MAG: efflux RND transporter periplasmic adaptor subunit [Steroidobacteraceae bacterium]
MNRKILIAILVAVLAGGVALGYWLAPKRVADGSDAQHGERRILYWYDPMKPDVKFDKPGKSPFMDMELVPRYANEAAQGAAVRVDPAVAQSLGIRLGKVEKVVLVPRLAAVGGVAFDENLLHVVQARVAGYVTRLYVKAPLEHVRRGQPLAEIQAPEWLAAQAEYLALLDAESGRAQSIRDAARERLVVLGVPEAMIRRIEETRKTDATTTVFAPANGVVTELAVREGAAFMAGAPLFRINGLETVWVNAEIPEAQVATIGGASVEAQATAWPGMAFHGRVASLLPEVDPETRTLPVRIVIENPGQKLVPGMFVTLDFIGDPGEPQLVVPSEAVIMTGARSVVVVARDGGGFDFADVTVGAEADGKTAILAGLREGQSIVLSGQFLIDSEASMQSTITRLESEQAPSEKTP